MIGFGLAVGGVFPYAVHRIGVPKAHVLTFPFHAYCLLAGLLVGMVNVLLFRKVVRERFSLLAERLKTIQQTLDRVRNGELDGCAERDCHLEIDSDDEIGQTSESFNRMVDALTATIQTNDAVRAFNRELMAHLDERALAASALDMLSAWTGAQGGAVLIARDGELEVAASKCLVSQERLPKNETVRRVFDTQEEMFVTSPADLILDAVLAHFTPRGVLLLPLAIRGVSLGVLVLGTEGSFSQEALKRAAILRESLALALQNAIAFDQLERLAALDPLTGCYNRRFGLSRLREEYERAVRRQLPLGVVVFDLDHFKSINDTYGHLTGDRVLVRTAQCARQVMRQGDLLIRYGGEEFVSVLPFASEDDAAAAAERLRRNIEDTAILHGAQVIRLTISAGVAAMPEILADSETDLLQQADRALYAAKQSGRNRVIRVSRSVACVDS